MNSALDSGTSAVGLPFTATVVTPLYSPDGMLIVPYGATLRGTLVSVGNRANPRLRLELRSMQTTLGPAPIDAIVRHAEKARLARTPPLVPIRDDAFIWPYDTWGWYGAYGGGPPEQPYASREIRIPEGASMQLVLSAPLIPPGTLAR
jgi:hypothetical protein